MEKRKALVVDDTFEHRSLTKMIVLLTSEKKQSDLDTGKRLGCTYYMLKPFKREDMKKALSAGHLE